jgi:hypothetical protein
MEIVMSKKIKRRHECFANENILIAALAPMYADAINTVSKRDNQVLNNDSKKWFQLCARYLHEILYS